MHTTLTSPAPYFLHGNVTIRSATCAREFSNSLPLACALLDVALRHGGRGAESADADRAERGKRASRGEAASDGDASGDAGPQHGRIGSGGDEGEGEA
eukprot:6197798-Pleurochrysis_carterae.AAC.2